MAKSKSRKRTPYAVLYFPRTREAFCGGEVVVDFFREAGVPEHQISALVKKCLPVSRLEDWGKVLSEWHKQHGRELFSFPTPPETELPPPPFDTPAKLLEFCQEHRRGLNLRVKDDHFALFFGRRAIEEAIRSIRGMGASDVPEFPERFDSIESIHRGLDLAIQWCHSQEVAASEARQSPKDDGNKGSPASVNARMIDLMKDPATHTWSAQKFATRLGCSKSSVAGTMAWKQLMTAREMARQNRAAATQKRRQSRG